MNWTRVRLFSAHASRNHRPGSSGEIASVTEADDQAVVEVVVLAEFRDISGGDPEVDVAE